MLNFFPSFSVDDECLSDDGRRVGMCMNVYECRIQGKALKISYFDGMVIGKALYLENFYDIKILNSFFTSLIIDFAGGTSRGDCALGFGACCVCKICEILNI